MWVVWMRQWALHLRMNALFAGVPSRGGGRTPHQQHGAAAVLRKIYAAMCVVLTVVACRKCAS